MEIEKIQTSENLADSFIKALLAATFEKHVHDISMRRLRSLLCPGQGI